MSDLITAGSGAPRRRPRLRQARRDPRPRRRSSPTPAAPTDVDQLVEDALAREADLADRPARRHRDPALPHHRRRRAHPRVRPARPEGRLRRQGRPGRPRLPDRRPRRRRRHPPPAAHQARPGPGQAGVHRRAARRARRRRTSSTQVQPRPRRRTPRTGRGRRRRRRGSSGRAAARRPPAAAAAAPSGGRRSLVAVTACPTGIAHTYMAAEALEAAAERAGVDIQVETQGSAGSTPLAHDTIADGRRGDLRRRRRRPRPAAGSPASRSSPRA